MRSALVVVPLTTVATAKLEGGANMHCEKLLEIRNISLQTIRVAVSLRRGTKGYRDPTDTGRLTLDFFATRSHSLGLHTRFLT